MIKKSYILLFLLITITTTCYGYQTNYMYSTSMYRQGQTYQTPYNNMSMDINKTRPIGYTTNYCGGINKPFTRQQTYRSVNTMMMHSTGSSFSPARYSTPQPRRITVYNGSGESSNTPGGNSDSSDWLYMQDSEGNWYCSKDGGITWYKWEEKDYGWNIFAYISDLLSGNTEAWSTTPTDPPENSSHWAPDPDDPFLTPIGDYLYVMLMFATIYILLFKKRKNSESI